jgi:hypothetical protein
MTSAPIIRLVVNRWPLFRLEKHRKFKPKSAWFPLFGRCLVPTVFLLCLQGCCTMRSSFIHAFCLRSKGISATASVGRRFEMLTPISIIYQLTTANGRGKKLPESKPAGSCIRLILLTLHPVTFFVWLPEERDGALHSEFTRRHSF